MLMKLQSNNNPCEMPWRKGTDTFISLRFFLISDPFILAHLHSECEKSSSMASLAFPGCQEWPGDTSLVNEMEEACWGLLGKLTFPAGRVWWSLSVLRALFFWIWFLLQPFCSTDDYEANCEDGRRDRWWETGYLTTSLSHWIKQPLSPPLLWPPRLPISWGNAFPYCWSQFESRFLKSNSLIGFLKSLLESAWKGAGID